MNVYTLNGGAGPGGVQQARPLTSGSGYLAEQFFPGVEHPALIVNPKATPAALVAWCYGECVAMVAAVNAITNQQAAQVDTQDLPAIFTHRLEPLQRVLEELHAQLVKVETASGEDRPE